jgi:hypothetical protein
MSRFSAKESRMSPPETFIVYLDDARCAEEKLASVLAQPGLKRWILVACTPRITRRIGKWLSHSARENWRDKWCDKLFAHILPVIRRNDLVFCEVATGPLPQYTQMLLSELGQATVIDARRPKFGLDTQTVIEPTAPPARKPETHQPMTVGMHPRLA